MFKPYICKCDGKNMSRDCLSISVIVVRCPAARVIICIKRAGSERKEHLRKSIFVRLFRALSTQLRYKVGPRLRELAPRPEGAGRRDHTT